MRRVLAALAVAVASLGAWPTIADIAPARRGELLYLLRHDCGSCHGMTLKGGLGSSLAPEVLRQRTDEHLLGVILDGMPGTPMPPWRPLLAVEEARWLVHVLRTGGGRP